MRRCAWFRQRRQFAEPGDGDPLGLTIEHSLQGVMSPTPGCGIRQASKRIDEVSRSQRRVAGLHIGRRRRIKDLQQGSLQQPFHRLEVAGSARRARNRQP